MKKDMSIEFLRVIACFFVVCTHILMNYRYIDNNPSNITLFMESFVRCAVPVFLMITGFVTFPLHKKYIDYLQTFFKKYFVPMLVVIIVIEYFDPYIRKEMSFVDNLLGGGIDFERIILGILKLDAAGWTNGFYFWYMFLLAGIYLMLPLLELLCDESNTKKTIRRYIIFLTIMKAAIIPFILKTMPVRKDLSFFPWPFDMGIGYILLGYEIKTIQTKIKNKYAAIAGMILYIMSALLMYGFTIKMDFLDGEFQSLFFTWSDLFPLLQATGLFISLLFLVQSNKKKRPILFYLGKISFTIYLIHYPVLIWLDNRGIAYELYTKFSLGMFLPIYIGLNFVFDILISSLIERINYFRKNCIKLS